MTIYLSYSYNGTKWFDYTIGDVISLPKVGSKVYFAARGNATNTQISSGARNTRKFVTTGTLAASGNIMSLVKNDPSGWDVQIGTRCFLYLFNGAGITSAPDLPGTKLADYCYQNMFLNCSQLRKPPSILPSTACHNSMYYAMFNNCQLIEEAPEIMLSSINFSGCMNQMFYNCYKLKKIMVHFTSWAYINGQATTNQWVSGVQNIGAFYCPDALGTNTGITRGVSACPQNWGVVTI